MKTEGPTTPLRQPLAGEWLAKRQGPSLLSSDMSFLISLPRRYETAIVLALAFGWFIYSSVLSLVDPAPPPSAADYYGLVIQEILIGTVLLAFLIIRGWRIADFGFARLRWRDFVDAGALVAAAIVSYWVIWTLLSPLAVSDTPIPLNHRGISLSLMLALCVVNGAFEEVFVCAYLLAAWRTVPLHLLIGLSAALRLSYHLYQGPLASLALFPLGLVFAWYFANQRRVVPIIMAHVAVDILALLPHIRQET
jgi:hypothetical protein